MYVAQVGHWSGTQGRHKSEQEPVRAGEPKGGLGTGQKWKSQKALAQKQVLTSEFKKQVSTPQITRSQKHSREPKTRAEKGHL